MSGTGTVGLSAQRTGEAVRERLRSVMVLGEEVLEPLLVALLACGHILIEGIPGTGKTLLARTLSRAVDLDFKRIQFTNDLMPSDIVGSSVWRPDRGEFSFTEGPLFSHIVLADEINRTSPRTLSCLLEAMESGNVSVDGAPRPLARPFFVLATRNPIEFHGTYPIPEAALDRFLIRVRVGYPKGLEEVGLYLGQDPESALRAMEPVLHRESLLELMRLTDTIEVREAVATYAYQMVHATRTHEAVTLGASPRAALMWLRAARARALLQGRAYVLPDDLKALALPVLAHRIVLKGGGNADELLTGLLATIPVKL